MRDGAAGSCTGSSEGYQRRDTVCVRPTVVVVDVSMFAKVSEDMIHR